MGNIFNIFDKMTGKYVGIPSIKGESAYEIAVKHGYEGTEEEWANGLKPEETNTIYQYATVEDSYDEYYYSQERELSFELPDLPTYDGGTRFYCEPTPIVAGETDFYNEMTVLAGRKEYGYETDDVYKTEGKFYVNDSYESFEDEDDRYATVYNTTTGTLDDYMIRSVIREENRVNEKAMLLFHTTMYTNSHWGLTGGEMGMYGTVDQIYRAWLYPVEYFEPCVNGVYQAVDLAITKRDTLDLEMIMITSEQYEILIDSNSKAKQGVSVGSLDKRSTNIASIPTISTSEHTTDSYVIVIYKGNDGGVSSSTNDLDPFITFTVHSCGYDYLNYKVWTTNMDGSESSPKYTITLDTPLTYHEYIRYSSEPLYRKRKKTLYKKEGTINLYGEEKFTGDYDNDLNPIFTKTLYLEAPTKSTTVTINRYHNSVNHNITGLIKFHEITPTWTRTISPEYLVYTGNCFALDENAANHGIYTTANNGLDSDYFSRTYLQVYSTETAIVADRGCNVWCYECVVVLRYTRELTDEDYYKYNIEK